MANVNSIFSNSMQIMQRFCTVQGVRMLTSAEFRNLYGVGPVVPFQGCKSLENFLDHISEFDYDPDTDTYTGVSMGSSFKMIGTDLFTWGKKAGKPRRGNVHPTVIFDKPGANNTEVSNETVRIHLDALRHGVRLPNNVIGNCMGNNARQGISINPIWIEPVMRGQNTGHSNIWHACSKIGIRTMFSAENWRFRQYIEKCPGKLTAGYIRAYPGHMETWAGYQYFVPDDIR